MNQRRKWERRIGGILASFLEGVLGREHFARLSRFLWRRARLDYANDFEVNGERLVLESLAERTRSEKLQVFDVGANVGEWSKLLVNLLQERHANPDAVELHLFEPAPAAAQELREWIDASDVLGKTVVNEVAVANEPGKAELSIKSPTAGTNSLQVEMPDDVQEKVDVKVTTIDKYCQKRGIQKIDFLKIDTEGNDFNVLLGAREMLENETIGTTQFEYNWRWINFRHCLRDVFDLVKPTDYSLGKITPRGVEVYEKWDYELENFFEGNFLIFGDITKVGLKRVGYWKDKKRR
jgi:FkbM family methyltransferase